MGSPWKPWDGKPWDGKPLLTTTASLHITNGGENLLIRQAGSAQENCRGPGTIPQSTYASVLTAPAQMKMLDWGKKTCSSPFQLRSSLGRVAGLGFFSSSHPPSPPTQRTSYPGHQPRTPPPQWSGLRPPHPPPPSELKNRRGLVCRGRQAGAGPATPRWPGAGGCGRAAPPRAAAPRRPPAAVGGSAFGAPPPGSAMTAAPAPRRLAPGPGRV